ncbi:carboxypeptidase-like regulatory domain-containing protein [Blastopirellula sp. J2-11]|uniref:carboxypeptidase-like regulatory domain-containing protein n=1 Tax=Blastopirellula sp. J2-11 TaxID=2943192 RepID=UPI0021C7F75D|nr:carboxypeptidase-like regulatory domain-containing protein [Blastopirellula sp. J2-11]UUO08620.1 carboxypeptidase-like regulatory domain-containing protein [Blastopirellula sp. J2-11]
MSRSNLQYVLLASLLALCISGCFSDSGMEQVQGTVTFSDGTPVPGGTIVFAAVEGNSSSIGYLQKDGTYQLGTFGESDGAPQGKYKVTITGSSGYGGASPVAGKYGAIGQSPLAAEIKNGSNTIDFQIDRAK